MSTEVNVGRIVESTNVYKISEDRFAQRGCTEDGLFIDKLIRPTIG